MPKQSITHLIVKDSKKNKNVKTAFIKFVRLQIIAKEDIGAQYRIVKQYNPLKKFVSYYNRM